jgi:hypothetical protein
MAMGNVVWWWQGSFLVEMLIEHLGLQNSSMVAQS